MISATMKPPIPPPNNISIAEPGLLDIIEYAITPVMKTTTSIVIVLAIVPSKVIASLP
jgi:hypothetical protein